jgi:hypothetical protein
MYIETPSGLGEEEMGMEHDGDHDGYSAVITKKQYVKAGVVIELINVLPSRAGCDTSELAEELEVAIPAQGCTTRRCFKFCRERLKKHPALSVLF